MPPINTAAAHLRPSLHPWRAHVHACNFFYLPQRYQMPLSSAHLFTALADATIQCSSRLVSARGFSVAASHE